eukprot:g41260.t1
MLERTLQSAFFSRYSSTFLSHGPDQNCLTMSKEGKAVVDAIQFAQENPEAMQAAVDAGPAVINAGKKVKAGAKSAGDGDAASGTKVMAGAAAVAGVTTAVVFGSAILGVAAAGGAAYAATRSDQVGEVAKSTGKAAVAVAHKAQELDKKHNVSGRVKEGAKAAGAKMKELNDKYKITDKSAKALTSGMKKIEDACAEKPDKADKPKKPAAVTHNFRIGADDSHGHTTTVGKYYWGHIQARTQCQFEPSWPIIKL